MAKYPKPNGITRRLDFDNINKLNMGISCYVKKDIDGTIYVENVDFEGDVLPSNTAVNEKYVFQRCSFARCHFMGLIFQRRILFKDCTFRRCTFSGVTYRSELSFYACGMIDTAFPMCVGSGSSGRFVFNKCFLKRIDFYHTDLSDGIFYDTCMKDINLEYANLFKAKFCGLCKGIETSFYGIDTQFFAQMCPQEGSFIGYKNAYYSKDSCGNFVIVKLLIPEDAKRSSATTYKCRCDKAKVLSITNIDGTEANVTKAYSRQDSNFVYEVDKTVSVDNFDENRWNECSTGIHFFISRDMAVRHALGIVRQKGI